MKKIIALLCLTAAPFMVQAAGKNETALKSLQQKLSSISSYEAGFEQTTKDSAGNALQVIRGDMQVKKPGKLRWQTEGEYGQLVVSDGASVWVYDADLEQVTIKTMDNRLSETPALLLGGDSDAISRDFLVSVEKAGGNENYQLVPKDPSQIFDALELTFSQKILNNMVIRDASGQITEIRFSDAVNNPVLKEELFSFVPPENVDVIDSRQ